MVAVVLVMGKKCVTSPSVRWSRRVRLASTGAALPLALGYHVTSRSQFQGFAIRRPHTMSDKGFKRMSLTENEVRHVAMLARIALTDEQIHTLQDELNSILGHIDTIQQLDLDGVPPTAHAVPMVNSTRPDVPRQGLSREMALLNAPEAEDGAFVIPQIVGGGDAS